MTPEKVNGINEWDCTGPAPYGWPEYFGFTADQVAAADAMRRLYTQASYVFRLKKVRVLFMGAGVPYITRQYDVLVDVQRVTSTIPEHSGFFVLVDVQWNGKNITTERETRNAVYEILFGEKVGRDSTVFASPKNAGLVLLLCGERAA